MRSLTLILRHDTCVCGVRETRPLALGWQQQDSMVTVGHQLLVAVVLLTSCPFFLAIKFCGKIMLILKAPFAIGMRSANMITLPLFLCCFIVRQSFDGGCPSNILPLELRFNCGRRPAQIDADRVLPVLVVAIRRPFHASHR